MVIIDFDGTLSNSEHRQHFAQNKQWDHFHAATTDDLPNPDVLEFVVGLQQIDNEWGIVTGKPEKFRPVADEWLRRYDLTPSFMLMRPNSNFKPDTIMKPYILQGHYGGKQEALDAVHFVLEDLDRMVEAWRNYGLPCWQVRAGAF